MSDKTEAPSEKRLRKAREEGNLARSSTLAACTSAAFGLVALGAQAPAIAGDFVQYTRATLAGAASLELSPSAALTRAVVFLATASAPVVFAAFAGALVGSALQVGVQFNPKTVGFKLEKLSPSNGAKRLFSKKKLVEAVRALLAIAIVLALTWSAAKGNARTAAALPSLDAFDALRVAFELARGLVVRCAFAVLALAGLDYLYERHAWWKSLMMSKDELKREHKESEGDPHHKAKRKAAHKSLLNGTARREVKHATVVVVNPTHVAVALRYDPEEAAAPTIVAKGREEVAAAMRAEAKRHNIPIIKDKPLAWTLLRYDVGDEVPEELYQAVAVVLQKVHELGALAAMPDGAPSRSAR